MGGVRSVTFGPLDVSFDDGVLTPRAWTLLQSEWAAELAVGAPAGPLLELCSGAGHIGQAAAVLSGRDLVQVDVDPHACDLARANARRNGIGPKVEVRCGDLGAAVRADERFALVLADPPYVERDEVDNWPDDPTHAIDGGDDGIELQRRCIAVAAAHLVEDGVVLLQAQGRAQIDALADDLRAHGLRCVEVRAVDEQRAVAQLRR